MEKMDETFESYMEKNPRQPIPKGMKDFLEFAKKEYKSYEGINWDYGAETDEEKEEAVRMYLSECMEALLLFKKFKKIIIK